MWQECIVWFMCLQKNLPKPFSVVHVVVSAISQKWLILHSLLHKLLFFLTKTQIHLTCLVRRYLSDSKEKK